MLLPMAASEFTPQCPLRLSEEKVFLQGLQTTGLKNHFAMKGVLLVNLGSPDSPTAKDVKPYLDEFLMDERVIDVPKWLRAFLVRGIILNTRPKKSAAAYAKIWWDEGAPLIILSERGVS